MKLPRFEYLVPDTLDEVLAVLGEHASAAKVLAGGQSLVPLMALRLAQPAVLVDLGRLAGSAGIARNNGTVTIDALVRDRAVERSEEARDHLPLLAAALPLIGHEAIRTRGTIGGSIAHADPAAELPAVALALDAELVACSAARGERAIAAVDFFHGFLTTALADDELLTEIRFPVAGPRTGAAFEEVARRHGDFAIVGAGVSLQLTEAGKIADARVAMIGVADTPVRRPEVERALIGSIAGGKAFDAAAELAKSGLSPHTDLHGTSEYRKHLCRVVVRRALDKAAGRARLQRG